jgi:hypothetical protein
MSFQLSDTAAMTRAQIRMLRQIGLIILAFAGCAMGEKNVVPDLPAPFTIQAPRDERTIQAALDRARSGDTVLVAPGRYVGEGNRDLDFTGKDIVLIGRGGADSCVIACGLPDEYHRGLNFHHGETRNATVDGFTITEGSPWRDSEALNGGAIACSLASPTIRRCRIEGNQGLMGGGAWLDSSDAIIEDCQIRHNLAYMLGASGGYGGGLGIIGGAPEVRDCEFRGNYAESTGGGLGCGSTRAILDNLRIEGNGGSRGGGGIGLDGFHGEVFNCDILRNGVDHGAGGAILVGGGSAVLRNCRVEGNVSRSGGTIDVAYGMTELIGLTIRGNGPLMLYGGSGVACEFGTVVCRQCLITDNASSAGGGILSGFHATIRVEQSTIAGNSASEGGGIIASQGRVQLHQCVLSGNSSGDGADAKIGEDASLELTDCLADTSRFLIRGTLTSPGLVVPDDPLFCAPGRERASVPDDRPRPAPVRFGDYRLAADSPGRRPDGTVWGALTDSCGAIQ